MDAPGMPDRAVDWVVFDLGGVLLSGTRALPMLAGRLGAPREDFVAAYYAHRRDYDRRSDPAAYWSAVAASCGAVHPEEAQIAELVTLDDEGWIEVDPTVLALVRALQPTVGLAVLSNAPASMGRAVRGREWAAVFEHILISGDLGVIKPDPAIYRVLLRTLCSPAGRVVFVDDRPENVCGAAECGIRALQFTSADALRASLAELGLPD